MPEVREMPFLKLRVCALDPSRCLLIAVVGCDCIFDDTMIPASASKDYGNQFSATKLWTSILKKFYHEMPLKKHRRQLRIFNDTFTGRDAVDFLYEILPGIWVKECTRNTAANLLQMFLKSNYLVNVRNEEDREFHDNITLYSFCTHKIEDFISDTPFGDPSNGSTSRNVRRISSFKAEALKSYRSRNCSSVASSSNKPNEMDESPKVSGRLSMSCGNLADICSKPEKKYFGLGAAVAKGLFLYSPARTTKNPKTLSSSVVKDNKSSPWRASNPLLFRRSSKRQQLRNTPDHSVKPKTVAITDADEFKLWKYCLLERFKQAVGVNEPNFLNAHFSGADVRWNCKMVGDRGIVAKFPEHYDELPAGLVDNLKKLSGWPGARRSRGSSGTIASSYSTTTLARKSNSPIVVAGAERAVFASVVRALVPLAPLIPVDVAANIWDIYEHFHNDRKSAGRQGMLGSDSAGSTITTQTRQQKQQLIGEQLILDIAVNQRDRFVMCVRLALLIAKPVVRRRLQIVLRYIRRIAKNPHLRLRPAESTSSSVDNRNCILERLSPLLFTTPSSQGMYEVRSARLLAFLLDHLQELLVDVPNWLEADVQHRVDNLITGKEILTVNGTTTTLTTTMAGRRSQESVFSSTRRSSRPSKTPPAAAAYCSRIGSNVYEQQRHQMDQDLLSLLDTILADENMTPTRKMDKLKTFQITYPRVFAQRFPQGLEQDLIGQSTAANVSSKFSVEGSGKKNGGASSRLLTRFRQMMTTN